MATERVVRPLPDPLFDPLFDPLMASVMSNSASRHESLLMPTNAPSTHTCPSYEVYGVCEGVAVSQATCVSMDDRGVRGEREGVCVCV